MNGSMVFRSGKKTNAQPVQAGQDDSRPCSADIKDNEAYVRQLFADCADVKIRLWGQRVEGIPDMLLVYCDQLCDSKQMNELLLPSLQAYFQNRENAPADNLENALPLTSITKDGDTSKLQQNVFAGQLVFFVDGVPFLYSVDIPNSPERKTEEANTDISIRGPRDGFVEDISVNVALIRKRLRNKSLRYEKYSLGTRSNTLAGVLYIQDIARADVVQEIRNRLTASQMDAVFSTTELEELLLPETFSPFPMLNYTGRPDFAVASLVRGRVVLILDGTPTPVIAPCNLWFLLKTPEDLHSNYLYVSFERLFRMAGLVVALFLPGFFVAITTYHQDQIPLTLLATLVVSRKGIPLTTPLEAFLIMIFFELFREAGSRLPNVLGPTLAVVGGLIIGQSAIQAGLVSPAMLVMAGITAVSTFTLVNQTLSGTVSIIRLAVLALSAVFGIFGFLLSLFMVLVYLANLRSFGIPYLAPLSPISWKDVWIGIIRPPAKVLKKRPHFLYTKDKDRQKEKP